jgi:Type III restriction enzyme, res subunit
MDTVSNAKKIFNQSEESMDRSAFAEFETIDVYSVDDAIADGVVVAVDEPEPETVVRPLSSIHSMDQYLQSYGKILGKKAVTSLKPLHVPSRDELPDMEDLLREPFPCQQHVIAAGVELLNTNGSGFIVGEMGTGKTLLAMTAVCKHAQQPRSKGGTGGKFRCLVLCPDHLIAKWKREIEETIPGAKVYYFGTLSKEEAKERKKDDGKSGQRPAINDLLNLLDKGEDSLQEGTPYNPGDKTRRRWSKPEGPEYYVIGRNQVKWYPEWAGISDPYKGFNCVGGALMDRVEVQQIGTDGDGQPITKRVVIKGDLPEAKTTKPTTAKSIVVDQVKDVDANGQAIPDGKGGCKMKYVTAPVFTCPKCGNVLRDKKGVPIPANAISKNKMCCDGRYLREIPREHGDKENGLDTISPLPEKFKDRTTGVVTIEKKKYRIVTCDEPLWWFTSKPYRYSLARIIQRKFRRFFKYLVIDEAHEQQSDEAAQSMAAGKLIGSTDHVLALTGTIIGGYAKNLYALLLRICPQTLRAEHFEWGKDLEFSKVYGRIDRIVTTKEEAGPATGVGKGCASMRRAKTGNAKERVAVRPGIMPTLFGKHMIGNTIFITLDEMAEGLPDMFEYIGGECPEAPDPTGDAEFDEANLDRYERMKAFWVDTACSMEPAQEAEYNRIEATLDFASKELLKRGSMKLLGTMLATTLGWPDFVHGDWAMDDDVLKGLKRYTEDQEGLDEKIAKLHTVGYWDKPDNKDIKNWCGVVTPREQDATVVYPKEQALVDICKLQKSAGHQVWVYCQMTGKRNVMPRLKSILTQAGLKVGIMRADDVEPKEREEWIARHGREFDVMICFPKLVSTGLDLFSKVQGGHNYNCIVFYETGYKLNEMRQAARRAWRIGQPRDCYIYYLYYSGTMQHRAMSLMSKKMAAALALEGEFSEEGLAAMAGEGDEQMALAKSMSEKIDDADMQRSWSKVKSVTEKKRPIKKKVTPMLADLAADAKPDALDTLEAEAQLLARTILERRGKPVPESAESDIEDLAGRFAKADESLWTTARAMAERTERYRPDIIKRFEERFDALVADAEEMLKVDDVEIEEDVVINGTFTVTDSDGKVVAEAEARVKTKPQFQDAVTLKVHQPDPEQDADSVVDNIEFDETLLAKMFANLAAHGMTLKDLAG